jgi:hypothetical protein
MEGETSPHEDVLQGIADKDENHGQYEKDKKKRSFPHLSSWRECGIHGFRSSIG